MDDSQKKEAEVAAAALLLLSKRARHTIQLALLGSAKGGAASKTVLATRDDVEASVAKAVVGARRAAQKLVGEAFRRQTGYKTSLSRIPAGTGRDAPGSLADQWATRTKSLAVADTGAVVDADRFYEQAAQDLDWAAARTATTEVFSEYSLESKAAFDELVDAGVSGVVRVWWAQLEACPQCAPLHGTEADASGQFPYGDPLLHVNCMCFVVTRIR